MGIGLLDSAGDGVHKLNHAVQRLLVLSGPLVSLGKEAGTHAVSHAQQILQLAVNNAQFQCSCGVWGHFRVHHLNQEVLYLACQHIQAFSV